MKRPRRTFALPRRSLAGFIGAVGFMVLFAVALGWRAHGLGEEFADDARDTARNIHIGQRDGVEPRGSLRQQAQDAAWPSRWPAFHARQPSPCARKLVQQDLPVPTGCP